MPRVPAVAHSVAEKLSFPWLFLAVLVSDGILRGALSAAAISGVLRGCWRLLVAMPWLSVAIRDNSPCVVAAI